MGMWFVSSFKQSININSEQTWTGLSIYIKSQKKAIRRLILHRARNRKKEGSKKRQSASHQSMHRASCPFYAQGIKSKST